MYDLVTIGNVSIDTVAFRGDKFVINGGAAYLTAIPALLYSPKVAIVANVGADYDLSLLRRSGMDMSGIRIVAEAKTPRFYLEYLSEDASLRQFSSALGAGSLLSPADIPAAFLRSKFIHVATNPPQIQFRMIDYIRHRSNARVSIDTVEQYIHDYPAEVKKALQAADIVFVDQKESELISSGDYDRMVIKKGKHGATCKSGGRSIEIPANKVDVVDKTGAGDVLAGVFLVLLALGKDPTHALQEAVSVATKSVQHRGIDFLLERE